MRIQTFETLLKIVGAVVVAGFVLVVGTWVAVHLVLVIMVVGAAEEVVAGLAQAMPTMIAQATEAAAQPTPTPTPLP